MLGAWLGEGEAHHPRGGSWGGMRNIEGQRLVHADDREILLRQLRDGMALREQMESR